MDTPTGNRSPNSEAEELCRQFATSYRTWNAFDEKTMCMDARSSDEDHEPLPHRQGEEAGAEGMFRKRKQWSRKRYVEIWDQFLEFFPRPRSRIGPHVHRSSSCCHGLDHAATWTRACELIVKLHWRVILRRPAKSKWTRTGSCLDWHMIAQGAFGMFGMLFTARPRGARALDVDGMIFGVVQ